MKRSKIVLGFVILSAACATSSQSPKKLYAIHSDDLGDRESVQLDRDKTLICEDQPVAGSHFPQRICMTNDERQKQRHTIQTLLGPQTPVWGAGSR